VLHPHGVSQSRLLMPFNDTWFYGDTLFIIDPWVWLLAGAEVMAVVDLDEELRVRRVR